MDKKNNQTAPATANATDAKPVQSVGIVIPYKIGGTAQNNAQPLLLIAPGENGPVPDDARGPLTSDERAKIDASDPRAEWYYIGTVDIAGTTFKAYGTHGGKQVRSSEKAIENVLGDAIKRADPEKAKRLAQLAIKEAADKAMREIVARNPALAGMSRADLLSMLTDK